MTNLNVYLTFIKIVSKYVKMNKNNWHANDSETDGKNH